MRARVPLRPPLQSVLRVIFPENCNNRAWMSNAIWFITSLRNNGQQSVGGNGSYEDTTHLRFPRACGTEDASRTKREEEEGQPGRARASFFGKSSREPRDEEAEKWT